MCIWYIFYTISDFNSNLYNINNGYPDDDNGYNTNTDIYQPNRGYGHDDSDMGYGYDNDRSYGQDSGMDPDAVDHDYPVGSSEGSHGAKNGTAATSATKNSISVWTVYIIVGSVAGGILLAGLVAIAIALCCQKEEDSQYKSTSVWLWRQGVREEELDTNTLPVPSRYDTYFDEVWKPGSSMVIYHTCYSQTCV